MKQPKRVSEVEARRLLKKAIREAGSQAAFADLHEMSRQYLTDVLKGRRDIAGEKILAALGLKKIIEFEQKNGRTKA